MVTSASEWRKPQLEGVEIRLPSGKSMRIRPVALDVLLSNGNIPDLLSPIVARTLWTETPIEDITKEMDVAIDFIKLIDTIIPAAAVEPKIAVLKGPQDDEITLDDIEFPDKVFIFNLCVQPVEVLYRFREKQIADVEAVPSIGDDGVEA